MSYSDSLSEFYQALIILAQYESGEGRGKSAVEHFVIPRVISLLLIAMENGNCIAPYFLHYIARKYPDLDPDELPDLDTIPKYQDQGRQWVTAYEKFIALSTLLNEPSKNAHLKNKSFFSKLEHLLQGLRELDVENTASIRHLFLAILMEQANRLNIYTFDQKMIDKSYESCAMSPDIWGMFKYAEFLDRTNSWDLKKASHKKLHNELDIFTKNGGSIASLHHFYNQPKTSNKLFFKQWMVYGALHGEMSCCVWFVEFHVKDVLSSRIPLAASAFFYEHLLWVDLIFKHGLPIAINNFCSFIAKQCKGYSVYLRNAPIQKGTFLVFIINYIIEYAAKNKSSLPIVGHEILNDLKNVLYCIYDNNSQALPENLNRDPLCCTGLALELESQGKFVSAEHYYRQALERSKGRRAFQYNLANILRRQEKNFEEQIELFFLAAKSGCDHSILALFYFACTSETIVPISLTYKLRDDILSKLPPTVTFDISDNVELTRDWLIGMLDLNIQNREKVSLPEPSLPESSLPGESLSKSSPRVNGQSAVKQVSVASMSIFPKVQPTKAKKEGKNSISQPQVNSEMDSSRKRALKELEELSKKSRKNLTLADYVRAVGWFKKLDKEHENNKVDVLGQGGSRVRVDGVPFHRHHGPSNRPSPGAQHCLKRHIEALVEKVDHKESSSAQLR